MTTFSSSSIVEAAIDIKSNTDINCVTLKDTNVLTMSVLTDGCLD